MLVDDIKHAFVGAIGSVKYFSFSVQDKFLEIKSNGLGNTEILRILRNADFHFLAGAKEMVNSIPAGENHPGIVLNLNLLLTEIPGWYAFQANKRMKIKFHAVFPAKFKVW